MIFLGIFLKNIIYLFYKDFTLKVTTSKSKNSESFYIEKNFVNNNGKNTCVNVRKLGTLKKLLIVHSPIRDDVMKWTKEETRIETFKYKKRPEDKSGVGFSPYNSA